MIKRIIDVSAEPARLRVKNDQLIIQRKLGTDVSIPCEDVGVLLLDRKDLVYTHSVITNLSDYGAVVIFCGNEHLPVGLLLPFFSHSEFTQRQHRQAAISEPLKKKLWQQIVKEKIKRQAENLTEGSRERKIIRELCGEVKSGDTSNVEAQAARFYWPAMMGKNFRRKRAGKWPNPLLDYGYMVIRAAVARALVSAGLNPAFGIKHHNKHNPFCLADDLVEPFRPRIDSIVVELNRRGQREISPFVKKEMLSCLYKTVKNNGYAGPFLVELHRLTANLWRCFTREEKKLKFPVWKV